MADNLQIKYGNFSALPSSDPDAGCIYVCVDTGDVYAAPAGTLVHIGTVDFTKLQNKPNINGKEVSGTVSSWDYSIPGAYLTNEGVISLTSSSSVEDFTSVFGSYADLSNALSSNYIIVCPVEDGYVLANMAYLSGTDIVLTLSISGRDMTIAVTVADGEYSNVVITVTTVLYTSNIVDNLTSSSTTSPLSANQGRVLQSTKQDKLVSGTNIRTINGASILGSGDIAITTTTLGLTLRSFPINGNTYQIYSNTSGVLPQVFSPTTAGTEGQVLVSSGTGVPVWSDASSVIDLSGYVTSETLATTLSGYVSKTSLTSTLGGYVPTTRTVNGKALSGNISLAAADIGLQSRSLLINGNSYMVYSNLSGAIPAIYGPTTAGSEGQIPMSRGARAPLWVTPPYISAAQSGDGIFTASGNISISNFISGLKSLDFISSTKLSAVVMFSSDSTLVLTGFSSFISGLSTVSMEGATVKASMSPDSGDILLEIAAPVPGITVFVYKPVSGSLSGWYLSSGTDVSVGTSGASRVYLLGKSTGTSQNLSDATVSVGQGAYLSASGTTLNAEDFRRTEDPTYPLNIKSLMGLEDFAISTTPVTCYITSSVAATVSAAGCGFVSLSGSSPANIKCYPGVPVTLRFNSASTFTSYFAVQYRSTSSSENVYLYRITKSGVSINVVTDLGAVIPSWYLGPVVGSTAYIPYMLTWYPAQSGSYIITKS